MSEQPKPQTFFPFSNHLREIKIFRKSKYETLPIEPGNYLVLGSVYSNVENGCLYHDKRAQENSSLIYLIGIGISMVDKKPTFISSETYADLDYAGYIKEIFKGTS